MGAGLLGFVVGVLVWLSGPRPSPRFHEEPTSGDFFVGSGTVLVLLGGALFLYGAWLWSRDGGTPDGRDDGTGDAL